MSASLRVLSGRVWLTFGQSISVREDDPIEIRGLTPGSVVDVGPVRLVADSDRLRYSPKDDPDLRGHLGTLTVSIDGRRCGEIEIVPGRLTLEAWETLRTELRKVWSGLLLDHDGPTTVSGRGLDPVALWRRVAPVIEDLRASPVTSLGVTERWVRAERVRSAAQLTTPVVLAGQRGRRAIGRSVGPVISEPERALVRDTLVRLHAALELAADGASAMEQVGSYLRSGPFAPLARGDVSITHLSRHEPRLRQVVSIRQQLLHASSVVMEGPGALRLGVRGMDELYEFWVFLSVLREIERRVGPPLAPGYDVLSRRLHSGRVRLELPEGTEVRFPDGIVAAFTPTIARWSSDSWMGLSIAEHHRSLEGHLPVPEVATPDVVIARNDDEGRTELVVIDAKYRAWHLVDPSLQNIYSRYSRFQKRNRPVVRTVIGAHPHRGKELRWPGQWALPFVPGDALPEDLFPPEWFPAHAHALAPEAPDSSAVAAERISPVDLSTSSTQDLAASGEVREDAAGRDADADSVDTEADVLVGGVPLDRNPDAKPESDWFRHEQDRIEACRVRWRTSPPASWDRVIVGEIVELAGSPWGISLLRAEGVHLGGLGSLLSGLRRVAPRLGERREKLVDQLARLLGSKDLRDLELCLAESTDSEPSPMLQFRGNPGQRLWPGTR